MSSNRRQRQPPCGTPRPHPCRSRRDRGRMRRAPDRRPCICACARRGSTAPTGAGMVIFAVTLVWSFTKRRTGDRSVQLAGHLHAARLGLDAGELGALRGLVAFGAAELLKEVEMPPGAAAARVALAKNRASSIVACEEVPATVLWAMSCLASGWVVFDEEPLSGRRSRGQYLNGTPATDPARARQSGQGQCSRPRQGRRSSCLLHRFSFGKRPLPASIRSVPPPASCGWRKSA